MSTIEILEKAMELLYLLEDRTEYKNKKLGKCINILQGMQIRCKRCNSVVSKSKNKDYAYQCLKCDEDLFRFETYIK